MSNALDRNLHQYLFEQGHLAASELKVAEGVALRRGESLAQALQRMELLKPALLQLYTRESLGYALLDLDKRRADSALCTQFGEVFCKQHMVLPLLSEAGADIVDVALVDPGDIVVTDALRQRTAALTIRICLADAAAIERAHCKIFSSDREQHVDVDYSDAVEQLRHLLAAAVGQASSDIHIEPTPDCARIRLRCDGVLRLWRHIGLDEWKLLLGRIKVLAGLDIADSRSPQDGRFTHMAKGREVDVRVSVMPTDCGEAVVMRILDRNRHALNFESLGIEASQRDQLHAMLRRPEGMLLVCGPTGSGKSTTLYALVESLRGEALNILTLEDPVEYPATWVRQTSISDAVSMDYAEGVRAALRQDPDVMLIGEMRDTDTAKITLRAAMTGHRVLTTVHANSALASVGRLMDLGLQPSLLAGNLIGVVAQRLLRKLCQYCKISDSERPGCYRASACERCHRRGYRGRIPVIEVWTVDEDFDELLHQAASRRAFAQLAEEKGMRSLMQSALMLMAQGLTSADEIMRVVGPLAEDGFK